MKKANEILSSPPAHWVGDGFPVRGMFGKHVFTESVSPFLMLDYAGPAQFEPTSRRRGVDGHPHKGFETVTIVYAGEVEHHDSTGNHGVIGPGDVQWMTAGAGILHKEYHSENFAREGGDFEMVQLWVNLPAKDKGAKPGYQSILNADIPTVSLPGGGEARVIAGSLLDQTGPAKTFSPMNVWDLSYPEAATSRIELPEGHTCIVLVRRGSVRIGDGPEVGEASLAILDAGDARLEITASSGTKALILSGEPLGEPIAAQGPFVMNTREELVDAMRQFQRGAMGNL
ncbi:MAG: pirin family protein [Verrucomicrobia bacterium]|nr:pirin family protein [Verrucomicrobiota bacterium]MCH8511407.1 pirin family protein [Kiritimatiellia bacterium]